MSFLYDDYGFPVTDPFRRFGNCVCETPCQETYECEHPFHEDDRRTPYCCGGADGPGGVWLVYCDECVSLYEL